MVHQELGVPSEMQQHATMEVDVLATSVVQMVQDAHQQTLSSLVADQR